MKKGKIALICACVMMAFSATACSGEKDIPKINKENLENDETEKKETERKESEIVKQNDSNEKLGNSVKNGNKQNDSANSDNHPTANAPNDASMNNGKSSQELFSNAKIQGSVVEFSDSELSLSMATTTTDENGGEVMEEAAPGMENEDEMIHVTYGENMSVRILTMNRASQTQISLEDADKGSIKKQTSVLIFGNCQDTYHWTADEIVIVRFQ